MTQLSHSTATTTRFSSEGCQKQTGPRCCQHPIRWAFYLASTHQMAPRGTHPENIYRPRTDERLSWPSCLTCSGRFTHIVVTCRLQAEHRTVSSQAKDWRSANCATQPNCSLWVLTLNLRSQRNTDAMWSTGFETLVRTE